MIAINNMDIIKEDDPNAVDTSLIFNTGLAAYNAKKYTDAVNYFKEAATYGYNGGEAYVLIGSSYEMVKDTSNALETLKEGFTKYPGDQNILNNMIQIYLNQQKTADALKYLQMAIEKDPNNASYYFAMGKLNEDMNNEDKAIELYQKSIDVDNTFFNSYYNLGALYYNKGVEQIDVARDVPPDQNEKYQAELAKADTWFEKALPFMEKCHELNPTDTSTIETLKNLYYRMMSKDQAKYEPLYNKMNDLLK